MSFLFSFRFYHSFQPIVVGVEQLAENKEIALAESGITRDLSHALNQTSLRLKEQKQKLKQRDDARTDWISGVSHDIRTPLALITGYSDAIMSNALSKEEVQNKAEIIRAHQGELLFKERKDHTFDVCILL